MSVGRVVAVARDGAHRFSKEPVAEIRIIAGLGVEGDAHLGVTVQHRSRVRQDPGQPNLRQVHLIHVELFDELRTNGFDIAPGELGENIATRGVDLLALSQGARLRIGPNVVIELTGLRNPCAQIDRFRQGLLSAVLDHGPQGELIRKAGVMAVALDGGVVKPGDAIQVEPPPFPHRPLQRV